MIRYLLIPISFVYCLLMRLRNLFYDSGVFKNHTLGARVISVGNITWGGTGKTPLVLFLQQAFLEQGKNPGILIRGYGSDESTLLSSLAPNIPVMVGKDRVKTGKEAVKKHSLDTLLLDDGFQYRRLKRDLDIVCIDALNPFGNGWVIPTGSMREGFESLKRADVFVLTRVDLVKYQAALENLKLKLKSINQGALIVKSVHEATHVYKLLNEQLVDMEFLKKKKIVLLSAIGNPMAFEKTVLNLGLEVKIHFVFRDHHEYTKQDIERIVSFCSKNKIEKIITTEKDAIKLRDVVCDLQDTDVLVLSIKLKVIENEQAFYNRLFGSRSS